MIGAGSIHVSDSYINVVRLNERGVWGRSEVGVGRLLGSLVNIYTSRVVFCLALAAAENVTLIRDKLRSRGLKASIRTSSQKPI